MNTKRSREASLFLEDDRVTNLGTTIGVGIGQAIAPRPPMPLLLDSPVFCTGKRLHLYFCKELPESPEPPANVTSVVVTPPTQRSPPVSWQDANKTMPRKGLRFGEGHPKGGSAESPRQIFYFREAQ